MMAQNDNNGDEALNEFLTRGAKYYPDVCQLKNEFQKHIKRIQKEIFVEYLPDQDLPAALAEKMPKNRDDSNFNYRDANEPTNNKGCIRTDFKLYGNKKLHFCLHWEREEGKEYTASILYKIKNASLDVEISEQSYKSFNIRQGEDPYAHTGQEAPWAFFIDIDFEEHNPFNFRTAYEALADHFVDNIAKKLELNK